MGAPPMSISRIKQQLKDAFVQHHDITATHRHRKTQTYALCLCRNMTATQRLQAGAEEEAQRLQHLFLDSVAHHRMLQVRLRPVDPFLGEE
jgi:hypothetical protein